MFETYAEIYDFRGGSYHRAMTGWPRARRREFEILVETAGLAGDAPLVLDVPSGGGYLAAYLPAGARVVRVDPASQFLGLGRGDHPHRAICAPHDAIPLPDASADAILSLAGLHHLDDHSAVFREWFRLLRSGGVLAVGDAAGGSATAAFPDGVVGRFNSMGHSGRYLTGAHAGLLDAAGYRVEFVEERRYVREFENRESMLEFCRTLFGMDRNPADTELLEGIESTVGFRESEDGCSLNRALLFMRAERP